ncbi:hypothetical protein HID58_046959 [Brassica napus]|uniref:At1g68980-like TPR repeats domain-containing protein n=1 Tax=Brassica napus TaxID=3708 RepID=A0ABQ8AXT8_BRANA|nr:hypothetical protein HID58_046959 [Brassica napus]
MLRRTLTLLPPRRRPFSSSPKTLTQLQRSSFESSLHNSLTAHDTDQAWKLFRSFAAASSLPDKPLLNSLITHLSSSLHGGGDTPLRHRLKRAFVSAAYVIEKDPTFLEFDTLLTLLQSMKLAKAASPALTLVECMFKNRFFVPFDLWGGLVIDICRESGTLASFLKVFKESCRLSTDEKLGYMKPDLAACNASLEACCLQMESLTDAESVIESMSVIGVKPDESTFGFLAYLYARKGLKEKIKELESLMDGRSGGIGVYVPILKAYCKENRTAEATQLVTEISSTGVQLDVETYQALIEASMTKQDFVSALTLFRDMRETRVTDLKGSYLTIMTGLLENQRPELMAAFVEEVLEDPRVEYEPNHQTYLSLINGYVSCERYFEVVVLWKEFKEGKAKLDHALADAFLNSLVKGGFFGTAMQVVEKCKEMKIFVDKWRYKAAFMEALKKLRLPKLRKRKMKKVEFLDAFRNWVGLTT